MQQLIIKYKLCGSLLLTLFLFSCSVQKEHDVTSAFLNDLKKPFSNQQIDTIEVVDYSSFLKKSVLDLYLKSKVEKIICADCEKVIWTNQSAPL